MTRTNPPFLHPKVNTLEDEHVKFIFGKHL